MPASAVDVIKPAFDHVKAQLFTNFRLGQWIRIAITGLLAGELSGAGGCSLQIPWRPPQGTNRADQFLMQALPLAGPFLILGIALLVIVGIILFVAFLYISSMMRFVLFDSIVTKECHIRQFWSQRHGPGFRYFVFQLLFILAMIVGIGSLAGTAVALGFGFGWFRNPREHLLPLILGGMVFVVLFAVLIIGAILVTVLTKDFVVPQMALEDITVGDGWRRLWTMLSMEKVGYLGYIGMKILLSIANAVVLGIAALAVIIVYLIPSGLVALIAIFVARAIGLTWNVFTMAAAIVAGCAVLLALIFTILVVSAPTVVFFPAYSLYFLAARYPALNRLLFPPPPPAPAVQT
jgi:hypothetical protein